MKTLTPFQIRKVFRIGYSSKKSPINQFFGQNLINYGQWGMKGHNGLDYALEDGEPLWACFDGFASQADTKDVGYGINVRIETGVFTVEGIPVKLEAVYAHLKSVAVKVGTWVKEGDLVAYVDNTGIGSTGTHLHFGIKPLYELSESTFAWDSKNGYAGWIDPYPLFKGKISDKCYEVWKKTSKQILPEYEPELLPVDKRYGQSRNYLKEKMFAFNPWIHKRIGRLPNNREISAGVYGFYSFEEIFQGKIGEIWLKLTKPEAKKRGLA